MLLPPTKHPKPNHQEIDSFHLDRATQLSVLRVILEARNIFEYIR